MRVTYLNSASVLIEDKNVKILCDPWLDGEEYFGSWGIYPPASVQDSFSKPEEYNNVNVNGTENILKLAEKNDFKVVYASSSILHPFFLILLNYLVTSKVFQIILLDYPF